MKISNVQPPKFISDCMKFTLDILNSFWQTMTRETRCKTTRLILWISSNLPLIFQFASLGLLFCLDQYFPVKILSNSIQFSFIRFLICSHGITWWNSIPLNSYSSSCVRLLLMTIDGNKRNVSNRFVRNEPNDTQSQVSVNERILMTWEKCRLR